jgi:hypothetical protein
MGLSSTLSLQTRPFSAPNPHLKLQVPWVYFRTFMIALVIIACILPPPNQEGTKIKESVTRPSPARHLSRVKVRTAAFSEAEAATLKGNRSW